MQKPKFTARVNNIYFLSRIGSCLRWATQGLAPEELSRDVKRVLERLDELEAPPTSCRGPTTIAPEPAAGPIPRALFAAPP
jgi:hypothetical protein